MVNHTFIPHHPFKTQRITMAVVIVMFCLLTACGTASPTAPEAPPDLPGAGDAALSLTLTSSPMQPLDAENAALPPDIRRILERGELRVAMFSEDRYPFFYVDASGELAGGDVDLAKDIARQLGVAVTFDRSSRTFDEMIDIVARNQADIVLSKFSITLNRGQTLKFTRPYIHLKQTLLINRVHLAAARKKGVGTMDVLNESSQRIGVREGTSFVEYAKQLLPRAELVLYDDIERMMDDVYTGRITAVLYDENEIQKHLLDYPERSIELQMMHIEGQADRIAIGVAHTDEHLREWLNLYLDLNDIHFEIGELLRTYKEGGA